jgi:pyridoxal phosphate enzyme (YggS family)
MLAERLAEVRERISQAAARSGRAGADVTLVVVTKNHPAGLVEELIDLGHRDFGENRDQEARPKAEAVVGPARWHFVGQLQTNKVKSVLGYASFLHSLDRDSLLSEVAKRAQTPLDCFIELNLTADPERGGVAPENLLEFAEKTLSAQNVNLLGLMAVAGVGVDPKTDFDRALQAREKLMSLSASANQLSMGMSGDYEIAVEMGATHVRVGSAITGPRTYLT